MKRTFLMLTLTAFLAIAVAPTAAAQCTWHDQTTYVPPGTTLDVHSTSCEQSYGEWDHLGVGVHEDYTGEYAWVSAQRSEYELDRFGNDTSTTTHRYEYRALFVGAGNGQGDLLPSLMLSVASGSEETPTWSSEWRAAYVTLWWGDRYQAVGGELPLLP